MQQLLGGGARRRPRRRSRFGRARLPEGLEPAPGELALEAREVELVPRTQALADDAPAQRALRLGQGPAARERLACEPAIEGLLGEGLEGRRPAAMPSGQCQRHEQLALALGELAGVLRVDHQLARLREVVHRAVFDAPVRPVGDQRLAVDEPQAGALQQQPVGPGPSGAELRLEARALGLLALGQRPHGDRQVLEVDAQALGRELLRRAAHELLRRGIRGGLLGLHSCPRGRREQADQDGVRETMLHGSSVGVVRGARARGRLGYESGGPLRAHSSGRASRELHGARRPAETAVPRPPEVERRGGARPQRRGGTRS
jgi:hypothetical protein